MPFPPWHEMPAWLQITFWNAVWSVSRIYTTVYFLFSVQVFYCCVCILCFNIWENKFSGKKKVFKWWKGGGNREVRERWFLGGRSLKRWGNGFLSLWHFLWGDQVGEGWKLSAYTGEITSTWFLMLSSLREPCFVLWFHVHCNHPKLSQKYLSKEPFLSYCKPRRLCDMKRYIQLSQKL